MSSHSCILAVAISLKNEWKEARQQAYAISIANKVYYLISKRKLAEYLTEGLAAFGCSCDDQAVIISSLLILTERDTF
jgi:hypothetical protein